MPHYQVQNISSLQWHLVLWVNQTLEEESSVVTYSHQVSQAPSVKHTLHKPHTKESQNTLWDLSVTTMQEIQILCVSRTLHWWVSRTVPQHTLTFWSRRLLISGHLQTHFHYLVFSFRPKCTKTLRKNCLVLFNFLSQQTISPSNIPEYLQFQHQNFTFKHVASLSKFII